MTQKSNFSNDQIAKIMLATNGRFCRIAKSGNIFVDYSEDGYRDYIKFQKNVYGYAIRRSSVSKFDKITMYEHPLNYKGCRQYYFNSFGKMLKYFKQYIKKSNGKLVVKYSRP